MITPRPIRSVLVLVASAALGVTVLAAPTGAQSPGASPVVVSPSASPCASASMTPVASASAVVSPAPSITVDAPSASAAPTGPCASPAASPAAARVSANTATHEELVAALTAAGVPAADRWAGEIEEYRPYDATDTTLQKLQDNLAKYDPDPATLAGILSVLVP